MTAPTTRETADHAELARWLREDADWQRKMKGGTTNDRKLDEAADAISALLSEIAALRGALAFVKEHRDTAWKVRQEEQSAALEWGARAIQAERQRDELREALIQADLTIRSMPGTDQSDVEFICQALANQGADQ